MFSDIKKPYLLTLMENLNRGKSEKKSIVLEIVTKSVFGNFG